MSIMNDVCVCSFLDKPCLSGEECLSFLSSSKAVRFLFCKTTLLAFLVLYPSLFRMASELSPPPEPTVAQLFALVMEEREAARADRKATLAALRHLSQLCAASGDQC